MAFVYKISILLAAVCYAFAEIPDCEVLTRVESGWVCGTKRASEGGAPYASFRGVPYAKQPLGELRFKELQPAEPWEGALNATIEGPICPFHDVFYFDLMQPSSVSEACIHANIHVPYEALPDPKQDVPTTGGLPILVYIHGGGWICGSGDADFNGPEYVVEKGVILITFNYRLDVFGFLSLNTTKIPGNNGLRDMVTLLRWVRNNARAFGGDPDDVTLAGQSAGAASVHLLTLAPPAAGLFKRVWLMSGTAIPSFYTTSPVYTQNVANTYLTILGLNGTDLDEVHDRLVEMPLQVLNNASGILLAQMGVTSFVPVVESPLEGITRILEDDPETLMRNGRGKDIPIVIGFTSNECEANRPRLAQLNAPELVKANPLVALSPHLVFTLPANQTAAMAQKVLARYFNGSVTVDKFVKLCTDTYFAYPAIKLARARAASRGAPVYLYKYGYQAEHSVFREVLNLTFTGAGHSEDMNRILKVNSANLPFSESDHRMNGRMSDLITHFTITGTPVSESHSWRPIAAQLRYNFVHDPDNHQYTRLDNGDEDMVQFFDNLPNELRPAEPWKGVFNASTESPVCPYHDLQLIYGPLAQPQGVSEACIHLNVHVPIEALPSPCAETELTGGLPIVVHIHGGSWVSGSGDADHNGPEYLMSKGVIVVTFNYRLGVFGFLSMDTPEIPGNNALRDAVTALRWVQENAHYFGGNPNEVTLSGQSAGATNAHLLSLSPATEGLFKRIWLMSGAAFESFYTASPVYAQEVSSMLVSLLGLNTTDYNEIHDYLIKVPTEELMEASGKVLKHFGLVNFVPVVETPHRGITTILSEDPEVLLAKGQGRDIPAVVGFANKECENIRLRLIAIDAVGSYTHDPTLGLPRSTVYSLPKNTTKAMAEKMKHRYYKGDPTIDEYVAMCTDSIFAYPAMRTARLRASMGGAPVFLYKFAYNTVNSAYKQAFKLSFNGAGHTDDLNNILKVNSWPMPRTHPDDAMKDLMSDLYANFIKYGYPSRDDVSWPPYFDKQYFYIRDAQNKNYVDMSEYDQGVIEFFDTLADV